MEGYLKGRGVSCTTAWRANQARRAGLPHSAIYAELCLRADARSLILL